MAAARILVFALVGAASAAEAGLLDSNKLALGAGANATGDPVQTLCGVGLYRQGVGEECAKCPIGWFQNTEGGDNDQEFTDLVSTCKLCVMGTYNNEEGKSDCKSCPLGYLNSGREAQNRYNYFEGKVGIQDHFWVSMDNAAGTRLIGYNGEQEIQELRKDVGTDTLADAKDACAKHGGCEAFCLNTDDLTMYFNDMNQGLETLDGTRCPTKAEIMATDKADRWTKWDYVSAPAPCGNFGISGYEAPVNVNSTTTTGNWTCYKKEGVVEGTQKHLAAKMSMDECEYECSKDPDCMAFDYNRLKRNCTMRFGVCFTGDEEPYKGDEDTCPRHCPEGEFWNGTQCLDEEPGYVYCQCKQYLKTADLPQDEKCMPCPDGKVMNDQHHRAGEDKCVDPAETACSTLCPNGTHWDPLANISGTNVTLGKAGCVDDKVNDTYCGCRDYLAPNMGSGSANAGTATAGTTDACMPCPPGEYIGDGHHNAKKENCIKEPVTDKPVDVTGWRDCDSAGSDRCRQGCNGFIKTDNCDAKGAITGQMECSAEVPVNQAGFCVCDRSKKVGDYGCEPKPYRDCTEACLTDHFAYWRSEKDNGDRDINNDRAGKVEIDKFDSGYCECEDATKGANVQSVKVQIMKDSSGDPTKKAYKTCWEACENFWNGTYVEIESDGTSNVGTGDAVPSATAQVNDPEQPLEPDCFLYDPPCETCKEYEAGSLELANCVVRRMDCERKPATVRCISL